MQQVLEPPALVLSHVTKIYRKRKVAAVRDVSLSIEAGSRVAITGPSGSGKSTLLNLMGGLDTPTTGAVEFEGQALSTLSEHRRSLLRRTGIGYVFQAYHLLPTLTCAENVAMPLYLQGCDATDIRSRVARALDAVGLGARQHHLPDELSGGERQRAAIARALVGQPRLLLADEPTGNLDASAGEQVVHLLCAIAEERHAALVLVTHNHGVATLCDRTVRLLDGVLTDSLPDATV